MSAPVGGVCVTVLLVCVVGGRALDLLRLTAPNPPSPPAVACRCASYPNVTFCSWPEPAGSQKTRYEATCRERNGPALTRPCELLPPGSASSDPTPAASASSERLWRCQLSSLKLLTDYIINVTAVSPAGSSSHLSSFMLEDIVKPDPPVDLRVSPAGRSLLVQWSAPPTWTNLDIVPLKYHILYRWGGGVSMKTANLGPFENTRVELKGLAAGRTYLFQVCAKELLGLGRCSSWSSAVTHAVPKPPRVPLTS
ncbi:interleukin-27 subunit beta [Clinocottus analis]|uniref:interleukin-27 subunit beta n=1 Tax=Clinocottus analis TaxID=304258 RepID=UPI0035C109AD